MTYQFSHRLADAASDPSATYDALWRAAACDLVHACLTRQHPQIIRELEYVFIQINRRYQPR